MHSDFFRQNQSDNWTLSLRLAQQLERQQKPTVYGIMVRNVGLWGIESICKRDGEPETYPTREQAQAVATERNNASTINNFNHYYVVELKGE